MGKTQKIFVESRVYKYINGEAINKLELTDSFLSLVDSFIASANASDYRSDKIKQAKGRKTGGENYFEREQINLLVLANNQVPTRKIAEFLFEENCYPVNSDIDKERVEDYIRVINNRRHELKKVLGNNYLDSTTDDLQARISKYINNVGLVSLSDEAIQLYKDALSLWFDVNYKWEDHYQQFSKGLCQRKANDTKFISVLCKNYKQSRSLAQTYLIVCTDEGCFTEDDVLSITDGSISREEFLSVLKKIKVLTSKK